MALLMLHVVVTAVIAALSHILYDLPARCSFLSSTKFSCTCITEIVNVADMLHNAADK